MLFEDLDAPRTPKHRLLFAVRPPAGPGAAIARAGGEVRRDLGLTGRLQSEERLHVTLYSFPLSARPPGDLAVMAGRAAERVRAASFSVEFCSVESFTSKPTNRPLVLRGRDGDLRGLFSLREQLGGALQATGLSPSLEMFDFRPHITLLYDDQAVAPRPVEPVRWMVEDFVLIHSVVGETRHIELGRWRLQGPTGYNGSGEPPLLEGRTEPAGQ